QHRPAAHPPLRACRPVTRSDLHRQSRRRHTGEIAMNKMFAVLKREYLTTVRKKMFVFMTIFVPVLMAALFLLPAMMVSRGIGDKHVAVIDGTGELGAAFTSVNEQPAAQPAKPLSRGQQRAQLPQTIKVE